MCAARHSDLWRQKNALAASILFAVNVHPHAKKNAIAGELGDALKLSVAAPASDGRANQACIEFLANLLKVPRSSVTIASGQSSRRKIIRVTGLAAEEVRKALFASQ
ncbi:MAG: hypothetical protein DMG85_07625 [Acidobacteria bacterium]|nr:MAG: hypothetical protein DMG85_07625 [Acidobacteriota bacterium]